MCTKYQLLGKRRLYNAKLAMAGSWVCLFLVCGVEDYYCFPCKTITTAAAAWSGVMWANFCIQQRFLFIPCGKQVLKDAMGWSTSTSACCLLVDWTLDCSSRESHALLLFA